MFHLVISIQNIRYRLLFWKPIVVKMPTLSSLAALQVDVTTTSGVTNDDKFGIMRTFRF